jgi:hypothetical protein
LKGDSSPANERVRQLSYGGHRITGDVLAILWGFERLMHWKLKPKANGQWLTSKKAFVSDSGSVRAELTSSSKNRGRRQKPLLHREVPVFRAVQRQKEFELEGTVQSAR